MLFRSSLCSSDKIAGERDHRNISRIAGECWRNLTPAEQQPFQRQAEIEKQLHALKYPNYKYSPVYRKMKGIKRKGHHDDSEEERCKKVASLLMGGTRTPELCSDRSASPFIPTDFIPPLDLSGVSEARSISSHTSLQSDLFFTQKPKPDFDPHLLPPNFDPNYFGLKSQVIPFEDSLMLSAPPNDESDDRFHLPSSTDPPYDSELYSFYTPDFPQFEDPFAQNTFPTDLPYIFPYFDTFNTPISPTTLVTSISSPSSAHHCIY
jgi:hypothetical protein